MLVRLGDMIQVGSIFELVGVARRTKRERWARTCSGLRLGRAMVICTDGCCDQNQTRTRAAVRLKFSLFYNQGIMKLGFIFTTRK